MHMPDSSTLFTCYAVHAHATQAHAAHAHAAHVYDAHARAEHAHVKREPQHAHSCCARCTLYVLCEN